MMDRAEMHQAAFPCTVVVLRRRGARVPAAELLRQEPPAGFLVCRDDTRPNWYASLFRDKEMKVELLPRLLHAQLDRENAGVRLYRGIGVEEREQYLQTWLCTPTPARAREILLEMLAKEGGSV